MLATPNHAWKSYAVSSKRKRLSCGGESIESEGFYGYGNASNRSHTAACDGQSSADKDELTQMHSNLKKARTTNPNKMPVQASLSESNVPFSPAYRQQTTAGAFDRTPTVEEQQAWSSGSSQTLELYAPQFSSSKGKQALASARSHWVWVVTSNGHTFVRCDKVEGLMATGEIEMMLTDSPSPSESSSSREDSNRLWDHIEGDVEMDDGSSRASFSS